MKNKNTLIFTISIVSLIVISFISLIFGSKILNITDIFDVIKNTENRLLKMMQENNISYKEPVNLNIEFQDY